MVKNVLQKTSFTLLLSSMILSTGCSGNKVLSTYNSFVDAINNNDYSTAYNLTTASMNPFMDESLFKESVYVAGTFYKGTKAKKNDLGYDIVTSNGTYNLQYMNNLLVIDDLFIELDLFVPSGSVCTYNGVLLEDSFITDDNGIETTYTINAPVAPGILHIATDVFGDSEREVDPIMGDENDFTMSSDMSVEISSFLESFLSSLNGIIDSGDKNTIIEELLKYNDDTEYVDTVVTNLMSNRRLSEPFTSYHNVNYKIKSIDAELQTSTTVEADLTFNVVWDVGEDKTANMTSNGSFILEKVIDGWSVVSINDFKFLYLNAIGGDGVEEVK